MSRVRIRLDFDNGAQLGPGKVRLLELIDETGSIRAAGSRMTMSYRRAWLLADSVNRAFRTPAVTTRQGGPRGGGAELTAFGRRLVGAYRRMEARAGEGLAEEIAALTAALEPDFGGGGAGEPDG